MTARWIEKQARAGNPLGKLLFCCFAGVKSTWRDGIFSGKLSRDERALGSKVLALSLAVDVKLSGPKSD
jgi:hypothetical protein